MSVPRLSEKALQAYVVDHLRRVQGIAVYEFGRPGGHGALRGALPTGWPDLLIIATLPGGAQPLHLFVELKTRRGYLTPAQVERHRELRALGVRVEVVASNDPKEAAWTIEAVLRAEGVELRDWE